MDEFHKKKFGFIPLELSQQILKLRHDYLPLLIRYSGMGYYYILIEHLWTLSDRKYGIFMLGGSSEIDIETTEAEYKGHNGSLFTIRECARMIDQLIEG